MTNFFEKREAPKCTCSLSKKIYTHKFETKHAKQKELQRKYPMFEGKMEQNQNWFYSNTSSNKVDILIMMEFLEPPSKLDFIINIAEKYFSDFTFKIIPALGCTPDFTKKLDDTVVTYSACKNLHVKKNVLKAQPKAILSIGRALYHFTEIKDLKPEHFHLPVTEESYFDFMEQDASIYSPEYDCRVFPVDGIFQFTNDSKEKGACFKDVYEKINFLEQVKRIKLEVKKPKKRIPKIKTVKVENVNDFIKEIINDDSIKELAIDTESKSLFYFNKDIISIQFAWDKKTGYFCDWNKIDKELLIELFNSDKYFIFHNAPYDLKVLKANGIHNVYCDFDTMMASWQLNENSPNGLKPNAWIYTYFGGYEEELKSYMKKYKIKDMSLLPNEILIKYGAIDPIITFILYKYFKNRLEEELESVSYNFYEYVIPAVNMIADVEMTGVPIDMKYAKEYNKILEKKLLEVQKRAYEIAGRVFNLNSDKEKTKIMFSIPGFSDLLDELESENEDVAFVSGKTGDLLLNKSTLPLYIEKGFEFADLIRQSNHLSKEISQLGFSDAEVKENLKKPMFENLNIDDEIEVGGFLKSIRKIDGKYFLYGAYKLYGTDTGRASGGADASMEQSVKLTKKGSFGINFQNIPGTEEFRKIVCPPKDFVIGTCDYDGMEVSIFSQAAGHGVLEDLILEDKDMHCYTGTFVVETLGKEWLVHIYETFRYSDNLPLQTEKEVSERIDEILSDFSYEYFVENKKDAFLKRVRERAKVVNWQILFGASGFGLAKHLDVKPEQGEEILTQFKLKYPDVSRFMEKQYQQAQELGYVTTLLGRKRRLPELTYISRESFKNYQSSFSVSNLKNNSFNSPIQGTSGQTTLIAMTKIWEELKEKNLLSKVLINVHDEVVLMVHKTEAEIVSDIVHKWFLYEYYEPRNDVRLKATLDLGEVWKDGKPWTYWKENNRKWAHLLRTIEERNIQDN